MVVDTSVLLAILQGEPEQLQFVEAIAEAEYVLLSAASLVEASMLMDSRHGTRGVEDLDRFIERSNMEIVPVDVAQARIAREAFSRFGKGRHPAGLNFGDCFVYALARQRRDVLLFKGNDFSRTDIGIAAW